MPLPPALRFWSLDALRGICASVVFLSHWHLWAQFPPHGIIENGIQRLLSGTLAAYTAIAWPTGGNHPAVICFFVLSGFCIHFPFARAAFDGRQQTKWGSFYGRRFLRIMPVYWTACLMGFVFVSAELIAPSGNALLEHYSLSSPVDVIVRLLAVTDFYPKEILAGNGPLATVGIEIVLYALYPLFYLAALRGHWIALGILFLGLEGAGLALLPHLSPVWVYNSVFMYSLFWYAGALAAEYFTRRGPRSFLRPLVASWIAFVGINHAPHFYGLSVIKQDLFGLVCVYVVLQCLYIETRYGAAARNGVVRALRYAGQVSYSLYVVHTPALLLGTWLLIRFGITSYSIQLVVTLVAAIAATLVVHYGIERVFYRPRGRDDRTRGSVIRAMSPQAAK